MRRGCCFLSLLTPYNPGSQLQSGTCVGNTSSDWRSLVGVYAFGLGVMHFGVEGLSVCVKLCVRFCSGMLMWWGFGVGIVPSVCFSVIWGCVEFGSVVLC